MNTQSGWTKYAVHVLAELERLAACYLAVEEKHNELSKEFAVLKRTIAIYVAIGAGAVSTLISLLFWLLKGAP